jgi:hypothetical protein
MHVIESMIFGCFLATYCGLSAEGTARARECLSAFALDPDAYPEERDFFRWAVEQLETVHDHAVAVCDARQRPQLRLIKGGIH